MQSIVEYMRLGIDGLFLKTETYRYQREASDGLRRGFILVVLIGLLVGLAALIGQTIEVLATPDSADVVRTLYDGIVQMPLYQDLVVRVPDFEATFQTSFEQTARVMQWLNGGGIVGGLIGVFLTPLAYVTGWLLAGMIGHTVARMLGGTATLSQTLSCTAIAAGVGLLNLVLWVPFAQVSGVLLLGLIAQYIAIREAHRLSPWRAFWATITGPLLLVFILAVVISIVLVVVIL